MSDRVTITGARASSRYGKHVTAEPVTGMADEERIVVSGGAYGIEAAAHRAVLAAGGQTIAVLANGLDRSYPNAHTELPNRIGEVGLLLSELPPGTTSTKHRFTARNRFMAALSGATLIPEAGPRSRSMLTATFALGLGRDIGAVPGPVTSIGSIGPNELIKHGFASVVTQPSDVIALLDADDSDGPSVALSWFGQRLDPGQEPPRRGL